MFYLLKLRMCGIKNIENPIEIEFYKKTINNDFNPEKYRIKAIYGENGSGKTAIVSSIKLLKNLMLNKNYLTDLKTQENLIQLINKKNKECFIETEFYAQIGDRKFIFNHFISLKIKDDEQLYIVSEKLMRKNGNYSKNIFVPMYETQNGVLVELGNSKVFDYLKEKTMNLLDRQTFIASLVMLEGFPIEYKDIMDYSILLMPVLFAMSLFVYIDSEDYHENYYIEKQISEITKDEKESLGEKDVRRIKEIVLKPREKTNLVLKNSFEDYKKYIKKLCEFLKIFKPNLKDIEIETKDYDKYFKCYLIMVYDDYSLDREFESRGIKKIMDMFGYLNAASSSGIVFIDELDANINDIYLDKLIEYFVYYGNGQLCFTAHNISPMNLLKQNKNSIDFISSINTVHTWTNSGNSSPENTYKNGFIEDSPFNVDSSDFLGIFGGEYE